MPKPLPKREIEKLVKESFERNKTEDDHDSRQAAQRLRDEIRKSR